MNAVIGFAGIICLILAYAAAITGSPALPVLLIAGIAGVGYVSITD